MTWAQAFHDVGIAWAIIIGAVAFWWIIVR